jgi:hypothetical protein
MAFMERPRAVARPATAATAPAPAEATDEIRDDWTMRSGPGWRPLDEKSQRNLESLYIGSPETGEPASAHAPTQAHAVLDTTRQAWELTPEEIDNIGREAAPARRHAARRRAKAAVELG